jgi:hypothetical protein
MSAIIGVMGYFDGFNDSKRGFLQPVPDPFRGFSDFTGRFFVGFFFPAPVPVADGSPSLGIVVGSGNTPILSKTFGRDENTRPLGLIHLFRF